MGRKPNIESAVKNYVVSRALGEPDTLRDDLAVKLEPEIREMGYAPPARTTMWKMISAARNREPSPEDEPWHMSTLNDYPMSPEGLAATMEAYQFAAQYHAILTIRQAKWIARLSAVPRQLFPKGLSENELVGLRIIWALRYAQWELWCEVAKESFDTTALDDQLATLKVKPLDQWETMAAFLLLGTPLEARKFRELANGPLGRQCIRRQRELLSIARRVTANPELMNDSEVTGRIGSLINEIKELAHDLDAKQEEAEP
jgi:hypothetical protein